MLDLRSQRYQTAVTLATLLVALLMGYAAISIPSDAGYAGVGPNFLPWVVSVALLLCSGFMFYEIRTGGFREMEEASSGDAHPFWLGFAWMSAGMLGSAALIDSVGFVFSCTLCFVFAARGLREAEGETLRGWKPWAIDVVSGLLISAPVFWVFGKFLAIKLPGLTQGGWI